MDNVESRLEKNSVRNTLIYVLRKWLACAVMMKDDLGNPRDSLYNANHIVLSALKKNPSELRLFWTAIFFAIELGHLDRANEMLDMAYTYRSFYRNNAPLHYMILSFLYAYLELKQKRIKSAKKYWRNLENVKNIGNFAPYQELMRGFLHLIAQEFEDALKHLHTSHTMGCRSVFLYVALYNYYRTTQKPKAPSFATSDLLLQTLQWSLVHNADIDDIVTVYSNELILSHQMKLAERIYNLSPNPWLLRAICTHHMSLDDHSPKAHDYYKDAERRQINLPNLSRFLIKSAFENGSEHIHHFTMAGFLQKMPEDLPEDLLAFIYHLLLTDSNLRDLAPPHNPKIFALAEDFLAANKRSRYANTLYHYYWVYNKTSPKIPLIEDILQADLCKFEISDPTDTVRYLYVNEWEKNSIQEYKLEKNQKISIEAIGGGFKYSCLNAEQTAVLDNILEIRRLVPSADVALYRHFYDKGTENFNIIAYLAKSKGQDIKILEEAMSNPLSSESFKTRCGATLGQIHFNRNNFDLSLKYYAQTNENTLEPKLLEHMLFAYIKQKAFAEATGLILRVGSKISGKIRINALKIIAAEQGDWLFDLATPAYDTLIAGDYNENLLNTVLDHYIGTHKEWLNLGATLAALELPFNIKLAEIILKSATSSHYFDEHTQEIFVNYAQAVSTETNLGQDFIYLAIYNIMVRDAKPISAFISLLEQLPQTDILAIALSHLYLTHDLTTANTPAILDKAITVQMQSGILFPIFKTVKRQKNTYIEKYRPFLHKTLPGKDVRLYYTIDDEDDWRTVPMEYWHFGIYLAIVPHFYNETITYYFSEELPTGSITTQKQGILNKDMHLKEEETPELFFTINNATIYEQMFRYEQVEEIIGSLLKDITPIHSKLM